MSFFQGKPVPCPVLLRVLRALCANPVFFEVGRLEAGPTQRRSAYAAMPPLGNTYLLRALCANSLLSFLSRLIFSVFSVFSVRARSFALNPGILSLCPLCEPFLVFEKHAARKCGPTKRRSAYASMNIWGCFSTFYYYII